MTFPDQISMQCELKSDLKKSLICSISAISDIAGVHSVSGGNESDDCDGRLEPTVCQTCTKWDKNSVVFKKISVNFGSQLSQAGISDGSKCRPDWY